MAGLFKTDTAALRAWLDKRGTSLSNIRTPFEATWLEIRSQFEPNLGKALVDGDANHRAAENEDQAILNSTPRIVLSRAAAGLQSGITNQSRQWFKLNPTDNRVKENRAVRVWLDETTETLNSILNRSNSYPALIQIYFYLLAFGTAAAVVYEDSETDLHVYVADLGSYWIGENRRGRVETLRYRRQMTLGQIAEEFGERPLPQQIKDRIREGRTEELVPVICHIERHDPKRFRDIDESRQFVSVYFLETKEGPADGILDIRSFAYNPILGPRWATFGSVYGIGCGHQGLADAKMLQALEEDKLRVVEQEVSPAMVVPASMKGESVDSGPGGVTYENDLGAGGGKSGIRRLFDTREQIQAVLLTIQETEKRLNQTFFNDLFAMMVNLQTQPKQMTAREVNELSGEKVALLGPILTRMNADLLDPLIDAVFAIAAERGLLKEAPQALQGHPLRVEYVSSLHVEQTATTRLSGLYRLLEIAGTIAKFNPDIIDKFDCDEMIDISAQVLTEYGVVRDDKEVEKIRSERARQQAQMMQAEMQAKQAPAIAKAAKDLSQTQMGDGTALDVAMEAQQ